MANVRPPSPTHSHAGSGHGARTQAQAQADFVAQVAEASRVARAQSDYPSQAVEKDDLKIEKFYGERSKLHYYLGQMRTVFCLRPQKYPTPQAKVLFASMHLRGAAHEWFEPTLTDYLDSVDQREEETERIFGSWVEFELEIQKVFGVVNEERAAARTIHRIKQKGSAAQYYSQFNAVASKLHWNDEAKGSAYYEGLKDAVKDQMIDDVPDTYKELVAESIKIDNRLYERKIERGGWTGNYSPSTYRKKGDAQRSNRYYGDPMDLDAMQHGGASRSKKPNRYGKKSKGNNERERRRRENLCYECGKSGHQARECKNPPRELHMMNTGAKRTGIVAKKADTTMEPLHDRESSAQKAIDREQKWLDEDQKRLDDEQQQIYQRQKRLDDTQKRIDNEARCSLSSNLEDIIKRRKASKERLELSAKKPKETNPFPKHEWLSWTACYDDSCLTHKSDKEGSGWFPQKPKDKRGNKQKRDQESLSMMSAPSGVRENQQEEAEISDTESEEEEDTPLRTVVHEIERTHILISTPLWREVLCQTKCDLGTQHFHVVYDKDTEPKCYARKIRMTLCQNQYCTHGPKIHSHQLGESRTIQTIVMPTQVHRHIWGTEDTGVAENQDEAIIIHRIIDDRQDTKFISANFECDESQCEFSKEKHYHAHNVDPARPKIPLRQGAFRTMVEHGFICDKKNCRWSEESHVHFTKN